MATKIDIGIVKKEMPKLFLPADAKPDAAPDKYSWFDYQAPADGDRENYGLVSRVYSFDDNILVMPPTLLVEVIAMKTPEWEPAVPVRISAKAVLAAHHDTLKVFRAPMDHLSAEDQLRNLEYALEDNKPGDKRSAMSRLVGGSDGLDALYDAAQQ